MQIFFPWEVSKPFTAPHLKRERIVHDLLQPDKHCAGCAKDLRLIGKEASERYEYIPASLLMIEDVRLKYACDCTVRTAGKPAQPIEKSTAGASLLAQIVVGKSASYLLDRWRHTLYSPRRI
jgi:transposase